LFVLLTFGACARVDHETVFDPYDGGDAFPVTQPSLMTPKARLALVPNGGADTTSVVDLSGGKVRGQVPVGRSPLVVDGPHQIVADEAHGVAWVVLSYPASSAAAGQHTHGTSVRAGWVQRLSLTDLRPTGEIIVSANPGEIAVSQDGSRVVVSHFDLVAAAKGQDLISKRATLGLIDPSTVLPFGTPQADELLVCVAPHGLELSRPDGATAYVACYGEDAVGVVNLVDTHAPVVLVPIAGSVGPPGSPLLGPYGLALSPDGKRLAIANKESHDVRVMDTVGRKMESFVAPLMGSALFPAWSRDGTRIFVPTQAKDTLTVLDAATGAVLLAHAFEPATCIAPLDASLSPTEDSLTLVCEGNATTPGAMVVLDPKTLDVRARLPLQAFPGRPAYVGASQ
jgi:DNA-binding beta-propeller fold protein YncE